MTNPVTEVHKRDGQVESFAPSKITRSILQAAESRGAGDRLLAEELAAVVTMVLEQREPGGRPSTLDVRGVVERVLMETGHPEVARAFILHGDRQERWRPQPAPAPVDRHAPSVVSSSRECRLPWDRSRICSDLVLQLGLDSAAADSVAQEVERRVLALGLPTIGGAMLEDLVELALLERGHTEAGASQQRIGLSRRLLDRVVRERRRSSRLEERVGDEVLRRYSLASLYERELADAHLDAELELDGLSAPRRALATSLVLGELRRRRPAVQGVAAVVRIVRELDAVVQGPIFVGHPERMLVPAMESDEEARSVARQLLFGLCEARTAERPDAARVLVLGVGLPEEQRARLFHRGKDPEVVDRRARLFLRELFAECGRLGTSLSLPKLRVLLPRTELGPGSVDAVLQASRLGPEAVRGLELGWVELGRPEQELRPLQVLGARVGLNTVRAALRCGRRKQEEFLAALRPLGRRAVDAGARRLRFLLELDEAGVGPLHRLEELVEELSAEVSIDLPGRHGYHCSVVPVGLDAAIRAITEKDPDQSEEAAALRCRALESLHAALPENTASRGRFELSLEGFPRAERRFGRADFVSFPRGRDILRLSHDGEAFRYGASEAGRSPRVLDPAVDDLWVPSSMELDQLGGTDWPARGDDRLAETATEGGSSLKLNRIEIYGFKSFARRTEFVFDDGITAVVGPNGCGKSNLVDALRWALGEQRPKLLRSTTMPDVVYKGGAARVDAAEVTLTFDNADGRLPIDAPEVQLTRTLTRDGVSGYRINDRAARLKDLRELLLDTGLGVGGYSFMEQGRIDYILNASALERRMLVEEAAGTSRYRLRRKEALRKLDRTEQDLARAGDMIGELERQVRSLKVQAGRARNYVEKRDRLHRIMQVAYVRRHAQLQDALAEILAAREIASQQEVECREELHLAEASLSEREQRERSLSGEVGEARTEMVERRAQAQHLESRSADLETRGVGIADEQLSCRERAAQLEEQRSGLQREREAAEAARQQLQAAADQAETTRRAVEEELSASRRAEAEVDQRGESLQEELLLVVEEQQRIRDQIADLDSELRALDGRRQKLDARIEEIVAEARELRGRARTGRDGWRELGEKRQAIEELLSANDDELSILYTRRQELSEELEKESAAAAANRSRLAVLEDAISRHEGIDEQVRNLLERARQGEPGLSKVMGLVADMITASSETAVAVEAALGPWAEALVVPDREAAIEVLRVLRAEGAHRVRLLSLAELLRSQGGHRLRTGLLEGAQLEDTSRTLLPALLARFDLLPADVPMDLCAPRRGRAIVGADGEMMLHRFETVSGTSSDRVGLITRRSERDRLARELHGAEEKVAGLRQGLQDVVRQIGEREQDRETKARERDQFAQRERVALQEFRASLERLKLLREDLGLDRKEAGELGIRRASIESEKASHEERRAEVDARREELQVRRQGLQDERRRAAEARQQIEQRLGELDLEAARLVERLDAARQAATAMATRQREREEEWHHLEARRVELESQALSVQEELASNAIELERLQEEQAVAERVVADRTATLQAHQEETSALREAVARLRRELDHAARRRQELELKEQERRLHAQGLVERVHEDLGVDVAAVARSLDLGRFHPSAEELERQAEEAAARAEADGGPMDEIAEGPRVIVQQGSGLPSALVDEQSTAEAPAEAPAEDEEEEESAGPDQEEIDAFRQTDLDELQQEVEELRAALQRLGPVNLDAIHDLEEVEGRSIFLAQQRDDLIESRRSLKKMIEEIDRECEVRFEKTFAEVREQFKVLFRRLFRGGRADLILLESEDPSEAGVDIVAAPPGKDPRSIAMLSGGERTMTATALLFSLFSTRPSPFCVLDEVDAALDEANIERFTEMVREFVESTQFVIVTHSKRTMAAADMMYGVTMEGDGVSRPISMKLEDAEGAEDRPRRFADRRRDGEADPEQERARGAGA